MAHKPGLDQSKENIEEVNEDPTASEQPSKKQSADALLDDLISGLGSIQIK